MTNRNVFFRAIINSSEIADPHFWRENIYIHHMFRQYLFITDFLSEFGVFVTYWY